MSSPDRAGARRRSNLQTAAGPAKQARRAADNPGQATKEAAGGFFGAQRRLTAGGVDIGPIVLQCFLLGITFGTAFQPAHNNGFLPKFDVGEFMVGPFVQSWLVPFVLAPIWLLYGYLQPVLDEWFRDDAIDAAELRASSLPFLVATWGLLAAQFLASDWLYLNNVPHWAISLIMGSMAVAIWKAVDGTKTGLSLGALLAVGAPLTECLIVLAGLWHYDRPDLFGLVPHWTGFCYATYALGVGNTARYLKQRQIGR